MGGEGFWNGTRRVALNIVTAGGTGKFEVLRKEAEEADERNRASFERYEQLQARTKSLANSRGTANREAHSRLTEALEIIKKLENVAGVQAFGFSNHDCPEVAKMQKTVVDFKIAVELVAGSGAGIATTAGAWAAVSALGVASTGTAIGGLSGAASTHAILAWFGGGSLITGGGGMMLGTFVLGGLVLLPIIGVAAWLTRRNAAKQRAEIGPRIESTNVETARLERIARVIDAECRRIESVTLQTNELDGMLTKTLQALRANMQSLKTTGDALAEAMNTPGFNFSDLQAKES